MALSKETITEFAKLANDKPKTKTETSAWGEAVEYNGAMYVKLDGSDRLTPCASTVEVKAGDRVLVAIKNHSATISGSTSSPSASKSTVDKVTQDVGAKIAEFEIAIGDKVDVKELVAINGKIETLTSDNVYIKNQLVASEGRFDSIEADNVTIKDKLTATEADITKLQTEKLDAEVADIKYAAIEDLEATNAYIHNLESTFGEFKILTTDKLTANEAAIKKLETEKLSAEEADIKYANIDFTNIGKAAMEYFYAQSGLIKDVIIGDATITGELVGVTIRGDLIEGNTIVADKLVIKGSDGLYYKLNTDGITTEAEQTDYNSLNGQVIRARTVTAEKISVEDLVAFDATIGGFNITPSSLYSGVKESVDNKTRGIYMDKDAQIAIGDAENYIKYYRTENGEYKLSISLDELSIVNKGDIVTKTDMDNLSIGNRNLALETNQGVINWSWSMESGAATSEEVLEDGVRTVKFTRDETTQSGQSVILYNNINLELFKPGVEYTLSFEIKPSVGGLITSSICKQNGSDIFLGQSNQTVLANQWNNVLQTVKSEEPLPSIGTDTDGGRQQFYMVIDPVLSVPGATIQLRNLMIVEGNKATDWSPAPEDMATQEEVDEVKESAGEANDLAASNDGRISVAESAITQLSDNISTLVKGSNGESMMIQTENGWEFNIDVIEQTIRDASDTLTERADTTDSMVKDLSDLVNGISAKTAYITMSTDDEGNPCIELGKEDNDFKVRITNTSVDFLQGDSKIAYLNNHSLYIERTVIKNELQIGEGTGFIWQRRQNGNLGLRWVTG